MSNYVVHPGYVTLLSTNESVYVDAGTLASYYGLAVDEYEVGTSVQETSQDGNIIHIHLYPRSDGKYQNIKTLLGDNGTASHYDKPVNWRRHQRERQRYI